MQLFALFGISLKWRVAQLSQQLLKRNWQIRQYFALYPLLKGKWCNSCPPSSYGSIQPFCCAIVATATKEKLTNKAEFCLINHCWSENYATKAFWKENVRTPLPSRFIRNILLVKASWWLWIITSHNSNPLRADVDLKEIS